MGEVYRAHDTHLERDVALKILPPEVAGDSSRRARFEQEAPAAPLSTIPISSQRERPAFGGLDPRWRKRGQANGFSFGDMAVHPR